MGTASSSPDRPEDVAEAEHDHPSTPTTIDVARKEVDNNDGNGADDDE